MAYRRRNYRRRYGRRRRNTAWYNKKYSAKQLAVKAVKGVSYLRGLVNSEIFKHEIRTTILPNNGGLVIPFTNIAIGDEDDRRTGNSIYVRSINARFTITRNELATAGSMPLVRLMLVVDKQQAEDAYPFASNVLETTSSVYAPLSQLNSQTVGRFTVLKSALYTIYDDRPVVTGQWNINLRLHVRYNGIDGTDIQKNGIYLIAVSNKDYGDDNCPRLMLSGRVNYHDN